MSKKIHKEIGARIKAKRNEAGITQHVLAAFLNIDRANISLIERGVNGTTVANMFIICTVLNCKPNDLFPEIPKFDTDELNSFYTS